MTHVCNYASRWTATLCRRLAPEGQRYCSQHMPKAAPTVTIDEAWAIAIEYNQRGRA